VKRAVNDALNKAIFSFKIWTLNSTVHLGSSVRWVFQNPILTPRPYGFWKEEENRDVLCLGILPESVCGWRYERS
jgi:hypothetical protein